MTAAAPGSSSSPSVAHGVRWSGIAVIARQLVQVLSAVLIARIIGPSSYGVISAAMIYVTLTSLILDQGLSAALIQRKQLDERAPGAVATVNILLAVVIGVLTWFGARCLPRSSPRKPSPECSSCLPCSCPSKPSPSPPGRCSRGRRPSRASPSPTS